WRGALGGPWGAETVTSSAGAARAQARELRRGRGPPLSAGPGELECEATRAILITSLLRAAVGDRRVTPGVLVKQAARTAKKAHLSDHAVRARRCACVVDTQWCVFPGHALLNIGSQDPATSAPIWAPRCSPTAAPALGWWQDGDRWLCWPVASSSPAVGGDRGQP